MVKVCPLRDGGEGTALAPWGTAGRGSCSYFRIVTADFRVNEGKRPGVGPPGWDSALLP